MRGEDDDNLEEIVTAVKTGQKRANEQEEIMALFWTVEGGYQTCPLNQCLFHPLEIIRPEVADRDRYIPR